MRTGVFVQARLGSTRLPAKVLLPLPGGNVIQHVMRALAAVPADVRALLTDVNSASALMPFAEPEGFRVFVGSEEDVLGRYCDASRTYAVERVVRATGDNPLVSALLAREIMSIHRERRADLSHFLGCPWGTGVEIIEAGALYAAGRDAIDPEEREHITTFLYRNPRRFTIVEEPAPIGTALREARVTIDTMEDYEKVERIFKDLYAGSPIETDAIVRWFQGRMASEGIRARGTGQGARHGE